MTLLDAAPSGSKAEEAPRPTLQAWTARGDRRRDRLSHSDVEESGTGSLDVERRDRLPVAWSLMRSLYNCKMPTQNQGRVQTRRR